MKNQCDEFTYPASVDDDDDLPRILIIGDSISIGYTLTVRDRLQGIANVHRIPENGGPTTKGLAHLDDWLGPTDWDLISFNWGLHDLKYIDAAGVRADPPTGQQQVPLEQYEQNLARLTTRLKDTRAKLIYATTTPVPNGAVGRREADCLRYNDVAGRIMAGHDVLVIDCHTQAAGHVAETQLPADVHFTDEGYRQLGQFVAEAIGRELPDNRS